MLVFQLRVLADVRFDSFGVNGLACVVHGAIIRVDLGLRGTLAQYLELCKQLG
jgi:hypothetical protein